MNHFVPPPVTLSDEEPIAAGGRHRVSARKTRRLISRNPVTFSPPSVTLSDEEPTATGGWWL
jgi:hypothetical protein